MHQAPRAPVNTPSRRVPPLALRADCWLPAPVPWLQATVKSQVRITDFFYIFLKNKCGIQTLVAEKAYNIIHALEKYVADADLEMFMLCLAGAVPDAAYYDQMEMLSALRVRVVSSGAGTRHEVSVAARRPLTVVVHFWYLRHSD